MELEKAVEQIHAVLGQAADLLPEFEAIDQNDSQAVMAIARKRYQLAQEFNALVGEQIAAFHAMLDLTSAREQSEQVARLVRAFEFGAKLKGFLADEILDVDRGNAISDELGKVYCRLEELGGQAALTSLLENPDPQVRLNVVGPLLRTAGRDRAIAVLRELNSDEYGPHIKSSAWTVLLMEGEETPEPEIFA
jgi:hypothetical protein